MLKLRPHSLRLWLGFLAVLVMAVMAAARVPTNPTYTLSEEVTATSTHAEVGSTFGAQTAASGNLFAVSAPLDDDGNTDAGAVYAYSFTWNEVSKSSTWTLQQKLISPSVTTNGKFGYSISMTSTHLVVSAIGEDSGNGRVYVYNRSGGVWALQQTISTPNSTYKNFGCAVSADRNLIGVGANNTVDISGLSSGSGGTGRAYVYQLASNTWSLLQTFNSVHLVAVGSFAQGSALTTDNYGYSIEVQDSLTYGRRLIVGAPMSGSHEDTANPYGSGGSSIGGRVGAAWVYEAPVNGTTFSAASVAHPDNATSLAGLALGQTRQNTDRFATTSLISENTLVFGSRYDNAGGNNGGVVSVYVRNASTGVWGIQQEFGPSPGKVNNQFGSSIALLGNIIAVGTPGGDPTVNSVVVDDSGYVAFFTRSGTTWTQTQLLAATSPTVGDALGTSVVVAGNVMIAGAPGRNSFSLNDSGSAYIMGSDNRSPVVQADKTVSTAVNTNVALSITAPTDADADTMTVTVTSIPTGGQVQLSGAPLTVGQHITTANLTSLTFVPTNNFVGPAGTFSYVADDGLGGSATQVVTLNVLPPTPTGLSATAINATRIDLSWTDVAGETSYSILRSTTNGGPYTAIGSVGANTTSYQDTTVSAGTTYYYVVAAVATGVTGNNSNQATATTPQTAPTAPSGLSVATPAAPTGITQLNLSWTDNSSNETGFKVLRSPSGLGGTFVQVGSTLAAGTTSYSDMGLTASTTYYYQVVATNSGGDSAASNTANGTTLPNPPSTPTGLAVATPAAPTGTTQLNVTWTDVTGETGYRLYRSTSEMGTYTQIGGDLPAGTVSYSDMGRTANTTYYYKIEAFNTGGSSAQSASASGTTLPAAPATPTGLAVATPAAPTGTTQLNVTWTDVSSETGYRLYRSTSAMGTYTQIGGDLAAGTVSYSDMGRAADTTYYYKIEAFNAGGSSAQSAPASGTTLPAAPTSLSVSTPAAPTGQTQLNLTWTDNSSTETGFTIYRSTSAMGPFTTSVGTVGANIISFNDTTAAANTTYYYQVVANSAVGASSPSNTGSGTTLPNPPSTPTGLAVATPAAPTGQTQLNVTWNDVTGETGYRLYRSTSEMGTYTQIGGDLPAGTVSFSDMGRTPNTTYYYKIEAFNTGGSSAQSASANGTTLPAAPSAPSGLSVATPAAPTGETQLNLSWTDNSNNETGFKIYVSPSGLPGTFTLVTTTMAGATSYSHTGLTANTSYYYQVVATNAGGDSAASNTDDGLTLPPALSALTVTTPSLPDGTSKLDLSWTAPSGGPYSYNVYWSTTGDPGTYFPVGMVGPMSDTEFRDSGLSADTKYYYQVTVVNAAGESLPVSGSGTTLPTAPSGLSVSTPAAPDGQTKLNLTWTDNSSTETGFRIYRSLISDPESFSMVGSVGANTTTFQDSGLDANTLYYYYVVAESAAGQSSRSNTASGTTLVAPATGLSVTVPSAPDGQSKLDLSWTDTTGETGYKVLRSTSMSGPFTQVGSNLPAGTTSYQDSGLTSGVTYYYQVVAFSTAGDASPSNTANGTTLGGMVPAAPSGLSVATPAAPDGETELDLTWTDNSNNETGFAILRSTSAMGTYTEIGTVSAGVTSYTDTGRNADTTYYYQVVAVRGMESSSPASDSGTTLPPAPSGLSVSTPSQPDGQTKLNVTWTDNSSTETGFTVYRSTIGMPGTFTVAGSVGSGVTSFQDSGLTPSTPYYYQVVANSAAGASAPSNTGSGTTLGTPPAAPSSGAAVAPAGTAGRTQLNLTWTDNSSNETGFKIYVSPSGLPGTFTLLTTVGPNVTSYPHTGLNPNTTYFYQVVATNTAGDSAPASFSGTTLATSAPSIPTNLTVTTPTDLVGMTPRGLTQLDIKWVDASTNETGFILERSLDGVTFTDLVTLPANTTQYTDTGLTPNTRYVYRISSVLNVTRSTASTTAAGTTLFLNTETPPVITNIRVPEVSLNKATITWNTNIPASCRLVYRLNGVQQGIALSNSGVPGTSHSVTLTGLTAAKTYQYEIIASKLDGMSNETARATSNEHTFTTATVTGTVHTGIAVIRDGADLWVTITIYNGTASTLASSSVKSCSMTANGTTVNTLSTVPVSLGAIPAGGQVSTSLRFNGAAGTRGTAATIMAGFSAGTNNGTSTLRVTLP